MTRPQSSILVGSLWMLGISLLLFFLPGINGLIGGLVGGYKVASIERAMAAALLPAALLSIGLWLLLALIGLPVIGVMAGLALGILIVVSDLALLLGAAIGGFLGRRNLHADLPRAHLHRT